MSDNAQSTRIHASRTVNWLENKVAIITDGSSGIGEGTARAFAREGAMVILLARQEQKAGRSKRRSRFKKISTF